MNKVKKIIAKHRIKKMWRIWKELKRNKKRGSMSLIPNTVSLNDNFWDCECKQDYIHPKTTVCCLFCGAMRDNQPDSRIDEIDYK